MGDENGLYPATGWHIRGEMGGVWTPPVKLLDGIWFAVDGAWLGTHAANVHDRLGLPAVRLRAGLTGWTSRRTASAPP